MGQKRGIPEKGRAIALLPMATFLVIFLGSGIIAGDFYSMPAIVAFLIALMVAFFQNREVKLEEKMAMIAKGAGDENIITMCLIFLTAGAFSGAVQASGGADSAVALGLSILPSKVAVVGLFVIGCFISISMGTSMGTIAALSPIALSISEKTGFSVSICIGAVMCGAMFGDNLSIISDTTIAAVRTQGCEMKDKFRENFLIVLPAAIITMIIFWFLTRDVQYVPDDLGTYHILQVLPYLVVFVGALLGFQVFGILIVGTILSLVVGVATEALKVSEMFKVVGEGIMGMYDITVISIIVVCIVSLVKEYGGIQFILSFIKKRINAKKGGELGIAFLALFVDACTANNTVAIVMAGPIAKEISEEFEIEPKRAASILDIFTSALQGVLPYGAQLLSAASLTALTPFDIVPYCFYPILIAISGIVFILSRDKNLRKLDDKISEKKI